MPEIYPQVLAPPIACRPLFLGFHKAIVVRNTAVVAAIKDKTNDETRSSVSRRLPTRGHLRFHVRNHVRLQGY